MCHWKDFFHCKKELSNIGHYPNTENINLKVVVEHLSSVRRPA
jgi:hypothetical protein